MTRHKQIIALYLGLLMTVSVVILVALIGTSQAPRSVTVVERAQSSGPIHITRHWARSKDAGHVSHKINILWTWNFYLNQSRYYDWAKFKTWIHTANLDGTHTDCSLNKIVGGYLGTSLDLYVSNSTTGANFHRKAWLPCQGDTRADLWKGLVDTPRVRWHGGEIRIKVRGVDRFRFDNDTEWSVSGKIQRDGHG